MSLSALPSITIGQTSFYLDAASAGALARTQKGHCEGARLALDVYLHKYNTALRMAERLVNGEHHRVVKLGGRWTYNYYHLRLYEEYGNELWAALVYGYFFTRIPAIFIAERNIFRQLSDEELPPE